jgi:aspartate aminotransferase
VKDKLYVAVQTISGTGSLRLAGMFLEKFWPGTKTMYIPNPSWPNHRPLFSSSGLEVKSYAYYDPSTCGLDSTGLYRDLNSLPEKSIVLFHACAHNPTGVDPKISEWKEISRICKVKNHFVVVDMAYQGFATGDLDNDAAGLRQLAADGHNLLLCQSFSKNMGLYGMYMNSSG